MASDIDRAREALHAIPPGIPREEWVEVGIASIAAGLSVDEIVKWSSGADNYAGERDVRAVFGKVKPNGKIKAATLFHHARQHGYKRAGDFHGAVKVVAPTKKPKPPYDPASILSACKRAPATHEYVDRKLGVPDEDTYVYLGNLNIAGHACDGALVLPVFDLNGELHSLQFILANKKLVLPGNSLPPDGCFIVGGDLAMAKRAYLCEGIGQTWSAHQATRAPAVCCFGAGRMAGVAKALRDKYPGLGLVLVADRGKESQCAAIAADIGAMWAELPNDKPPNYDLNDYHRDVRDLNAVAGVLEGAKWAETHAAVALKFPRIWLNDARFDRTSDYFIKRLLTPGFIVVFGPSGGGKTYVVLDLLGHITAGLRYRGRRVRQCLWVYIAAEAGASITPRVYAWADRHLAQSREERVPFVIITRGMNLLNAVEVEALILELHAISDEAGLPVGGVAFDTLSRSIPGADENSAEHMTQAVAVADRLRDELGASCLFVHHSGKDATRGPRGSGALFAAADTVLCVADRTITVEKSRDGASGERLAFDLEVVTLGEDQDGDPITTCVVLPVDAPSPPSKAPKLSPDEHIALEALREELSITGEVMPGTSVLPQGVKAIRIEAWRTRFYARLGDVRELESAAKRQAWHRGRKGLIRAHVVTCWEDFAWLM